MLEYASALDSRSCAVATEPPIALRKYLSSALIALGGWMFRHRAWLPVPFALSLVHLSRRGTHSASLTITGGLLVLAGESLRIWATRHIGVIARTRTSRVGPLVVSGPFAIVRNPLYVGNMLLWSGVTCWAGLPRILPLCWLFFFLHYYVMARWEEHLLATHYGEAYRRYARRVPACIPQRWRRPAARADASFGWKDTIFSERGTVLALAVMAGLLVLRS